MAGMDGVYDVLVWLFPASSIYAHEWMALPTNSRRKQCAVHSEELLVVEEHPSWVLLDRPWGSSIYAVRLCTVTSVCVLTLKGQEDACKCNDAGKGLYFFWLCICGSAVVICNKLAPDRDGHLTSKTISTLFQCNPFKRAFVFVNGWSFSYWVTLSQVATASGLVPFSIP